MLQDGFRGDDGALVGESLVVGLDKTQIVEIVDHQPVRLAQALGRDIAQPVEPLEPGTIAEMEAGHRVDRLPAAALGAEIVGRGKRQQDRLQPLGNRRIDVPTRMAKCLQRLKVDAGETGRCRVGLYLREPAREARRRGQA